MPGPVYNTTGKDDADYARTVRQAVVTRLKPKTPPRKGSYYESTVKRQEDGEEG